MSSWSCLPELSFVSVFVVVFVFVFIIVFIFVTILVFISHLPEHPRLAELLKAWRCVAQNSQGGRLRTHTHIIIMMVVKGKMMRNLQFEVKIICAVFVTPSLVHKFQSRFIKQYSDKRGDGGVRSS